MVLGKLVLVQASVLLGTLASPLAQTCLNPYPDKPRLVFRDDGTFKITVFSDLHYGENPWDWWGPVQDSNSTRVMKRVLKDETPDYVVINGDLITGENTFKENSTTLIDEIVAPLNAVKVPFSSTHGNHDNQVNITHAEEITRERQVAPLSYTRFSPPGIGGPGGAGNYWVPVITLDDAPSLILWFFDSRGGVDQTGKPGQDWVDESVARWLELETKTMDAVWGPGEQRSALAFVHIPPHYIQPVQSTITPEKNPGLNADTLGGPGSGSVQSTFDPNEQDKDGPFWDSVNANVKNLFAVISGHDHGNEWCAREPTKNVVFCFDKHSGYGGYGDPSWGYGVRNIVFHPAKGKPKVESWIRLEEGETRAHVWLDDNLGR
ncbi:Metallo-dependent phosphatase [Macrolepiota fuliginosa MF-IS2]|uniref:Metallo-dependent phosphatase n=1 Tax=Macrolepiota fuliginosa MF-IS2 TaxID=1400762 RepID=A0A9P6C2D9_9AGAR|nr:Metallo-dependent phosphatase [Macrolepiota fuliginosa MF-IS2]